MERDPRPVNSSSQERFTFNSLESFTWYCVQSVGTYRVEERFKSEPEVTLGESTVIRTDGKCISMCILLHVHDCAFSFLVQTKLRNLVLSS